MAEYSENVVANTGAYGERAREIVEQEIDRAKSLDTKAGAVIAASVALIGASVAFVLQLADQEASAGARELWAVEIGIGTVALLFAGAFAVLALAPRVVRSQIAYHELEKWLTRPVLENHPTLNAGTILRGSILSIGVSRTANNKKSLFLRLASIALGAGLAAIVALAISVAVNHADTGGDNGRSRGTTKESAGRSGAVRGAGRADLPIAGYGYGATRGS